MAEIPTECINDPEELYPLLYSESQSIQRAAFRVLHRSIPRAQEQISLDVALSKATARLPEELLSLILEPPTLDSLANASFEHTVPNPLQGYLLSWLLIFDHFPSASYKVRSDYAASIKEGAYLNPLLSLLFDFLGFSYAKPIDASKHSITTYDPLLAFSASPEHQTQSLLIHIYYQTLLHLPNLAKTWWIDTPPRLKGPIESWTQKYISPLIILSAMDSVQSWLDAQPAPDLESFEVKLSPRNASFTASIPVDEQTLSIRLTLPPSYPLSSCTVHGLNRVLVDEKKWRSWLLSTQGVILFSSGSIVDGLTAFRRNVQGALKGQSECAICYSVVSGEKTLPSKRCGTCNNCFHGGCLYRWFRSSNSSSCPLCRNSFHYA